MCGQNNTDEPLADWERELLGAQEAHNNQAELEKELAENLAELNEYVRQVEENNNLYWTINGKHYVFADDPNNLIENYTQNPDTEELVLARQLKVGDVVVTVEVRSPIRRNEKPRKYNELDHYRWFMVEHVEPSENNDSVLLVIGRHADGTQSVHHVNRQLSFYRKREVEYRTVIVVKE